jgi:hypothetical protein
MAARRYLEMDKLGFQQRLHPPPRQQAAGASFHPGRLNLRSDPCGEENTVRPIPILRSAAHPEPMSVP